MEHTAHEPQPPAITTSCFRHDGWTGEKMATFCETLAETAVVAEACEVARMGISGAYAARRRSPEFAAAWDAALGIARERLADTLLARSMEGNVEQIYKDGELVGERHLIDNRLGLAILRRLDRLADTGLSTSTRGERAATAPKPAKKAIDWNLAMDAFRTGDEELVGKALAMFEGDKVEEVEGPPDSLIRADADDTLDLSDRCWWDDEEDCWMTDFPPPPGFDDYESRDYDDIGNATAYERACTPAEEAALNAEAASGRAAERAEDEDLRDCWFDLLREEAAGGDGVTPDLIRGPPSSGSIDANEVDAGSSPA